MKSPISILGIAFILTACVSNPPIPEDATKYEPLWEKTIAGGGCVSASHDGSMLYLVSHSRKYGNKAHVSVYDSRTGLFVTVELKRQIDRGFSCASVLLAKEATQPYATLNTILSDEFRSLFDAFLSAPNTLQDAVTGSVETYFREDGKWRGKRAAANLDEGGGFPKPTIRRANDLALFMRGLDAKRAQSYVSMRKSFLDKIDNEEEAKVRYQQESALNWDKRLSAKLSVGDKVCTYETNLYGQVEQIQGSKIKVHIVGQVASPLGVVRPGFFFGTGYLGNVPSYRVEAPRWFDRSELGHCGFN